MSRFQAAFLRMVSRHQGVRATARAEGVSPATVSRIARGEEADPATARKIGPTVGICPTCDGNWPEKEHLAGVGTTSDEVMRPVKGVYVGAPACFALELACQPVNRAFGGFGCFLVGSALTRPDWRDVDIRYIMQDDEFEAEFPSVNLAAVNWEFDAKWILLSTGISAYLKHASGLPIDFQFQPQTHANKHHKGKPRNALGLYFASEPSP